jgi:hypothetical protein
MKLSKRLLFLIILIALIPLISSLLIEFIFMNNRGGFLQWFLLGFSIFGCGSGAVYFLSIYAIERQNCLDKLNVFFVNFLLYLSDFKDFMKNPELYRDALERLKKIRDDKILYEKQKKNFLLVFSAYPRIIDEFAKYINEYIAIHNLYVPKILNSPAIADRDLAYRTAANKIKDISRRGYATVSRYAKYRKGAYYFEDFKNMIGAREFDKK